MPEPLTESPLVIPARYCGPHSSGNGGYTAGVLADRFARHPGLDGGCRVVEVTLRKPPPLDTDLRVEHVGGPATRLTDADVLVAEARCSDEELAAVDAVSPAEAAEAMAAFPGFRAHPFPRCFVCGPDRAEGDGLRIFPGPVGGGRVASTWVPHAGLAESSDLLDPDLHRVGVGTSWAALDCVGGWVSDLEGRPMVLGQIAARVDTLPVVGEPHVVVGAELSSQGRKTFTASTIYDSDGRIVARARHTWIAIDPAAFA